MPGMSYTTIIVNNATKCSQQYGFCTIEKIPPDEVVNYVDCPIIAAGQSASFNASPEDKFATIGVITAGALLDKFSIERDEKEGITTVNLSKMVHVLHLDLRDHPGGTFTVTSDGDSMTLVKTASATNHDRK